jgi:mevalonate kinase
MAGKQQIRAHGKLLISGEYLVLEGAKALAIPTRYGQVLSLETGDESTTGFEWRSLKEDGSVWFEGYFDKERFEWRHQNDQGPAITLQKIFAELAKSDPETWSRTKNLQIQADFPLHWGLGSSSTLVWGLSSLYGADAFAINRKLFHGSGYDIACAGSQSPILYQIKNGSPEWSSIEWNPDYAGAICFVYLGNKQSSKNEISRYQQNRRSEQELIKRISELSEAIAHNQTDLGTFMKQIQEHEDLLARHLGKPMVKTERFGDFSGAVKSLGAWGGDFILAASADVDMPSYFRGKGYDICVSFREMFLTLKM